MTKVYFSFRKSDGDAMIRQNSLKRRILPALLAFVLVLSGAGTVFSDAAVYAASSPKISSKSASLDPGDKMTIRLRNAKGKVKWSTSSRKVAVVSKRRGKKGAVITVTAKKAGTCTITAKSAGRKYKCRITVSNIKKRKISSSSVEKSSSYSWKKKLGTDGGDAFAVNVSDFTFDLLRQQTASGVISTKGQNLLISPDSILTAMIMLQNGARGNTRAEMRKVLSGGISDDRMNSYIAGLNNRLAASEKMTYRQANSLWIRKGSLKLKKSFLKKNKQYHNAQVYTAPFNKRTVKDINNWVYNNSRNMIKRIISMLTPEDRMVLINTTAFEGKWATPFSPPMKDSFTSYSGSKSTVRMLSDTGNYRYISLKGGKGFAKEYAGNGKNHSISFVGILPPEGKDVNEFAAGISGSDWINAWKSSSRQRLRIKVPEFKYDYSVSLAKPLYNMGIRDAFTSSADFSGISSKGKMLQIDDVLHRTHIELDRNGTKAAAATAIVAKAGSALITEPPAVYLDRPFLYALVDNKTGIPLFIGILYKVQQ